MSKDVISKIIISLDMAHEQLHYLQDDAKYYPVARDRIYTVMKKLKQLMDEVEDIVEQEEELQKMQPPKPNPTRVTNSNAPLFDQGRGRTARRS